MATLPQTIDIVSGPDNEFSFRVNGEEFPYFIAREPIDVSLDPDGLSSVTITVYANQITVNETR